MISSMNGLFLVTAITYIPFVLIPIGLLFISMNWLCLLESLRKKHFVSVVPLVGPLFLGAGLLLYEKTKPFAALALIVDYGTCIVIMKIEHDPPQAADEHGAKLIQCGRRGPWRQDERQFILTEYNKDRKTILEQISEAEYIAHESGFAKDSEFSNDSLTNIKFQLK